ncbi:MAG: hemerythrin domain-containing protein [Cytophaga sp.]|uniref:hemerythrin domain-containing protein n=1 Tax=Cytophaga sp. TaxID=29535 RepID=UPI003F7CFF1A
MPPRWPTLAQAFACALYLLQPSGIYIRCSEPKQGKRFRRGEYPLAQAFACALYLLQPPAMFNSMKSLHTNSRVSISPFDVTTCSPGFVNLLHHKYFLIMETTEKTIDNSRRSFIETGIKIAAGSAMAGSLFLIGCSKEKEDEEKEVSPPEDLMQEHGLLNRILLIYDSCKLKLMRKESFPMEALADSAKIIRAFIEDYHEKQEEDYLFPRFKKANQLTDLVDVLLRQHQAGRYITSQIMQLTAEKTLRGDEQQTLINLLASFNTMYRPHEAREDTVLFPAFRKIVSRHEYDSLGEEFEKNEHKLFGKDGFETMVHHVEHIEKKLGIYKLDGFTPDLIAL